MRALAAAVLVATAVAGCASHAVPTPPPSPVARTTDGPFLLEIRATKALYAPDDPVLVSATLTYTGPDASILITHANSVMAFGVVEPVNGIKMTPGWRLSCVRSTLQRGVPINASFVKSGTQPDGMPVASFMAFINDPRMPPGSWHIYVEAVFDEGNACTSSGGAHHDVRADLPVLVSPAT